MPSMRIIDDEEVKVAGQTISPSALPKLKIRNKRTGEIREIDPMESQNFGLAPAEALNRVKALVELQKIAGGVPTEEPLSAEASRLKGTIESGLASIESLDNILNPDKEKPGLEGRGRLTTRALSFGLGARELGTEITNLSDVIGRLRSGAAINKDEEKRFLKMLPGPLDPDDVIETKLDRLRTELNAVATGIGIKSEKKIDKEEQTVAEQATGGFQSVEPSALESMSFGQQEPEIPQEEGRVREVAEKVAGATPLVSSIAGGLAGSVAGPAGMIVGGAGGYMAGDIVKQTIRTALDKQDKPVEQQIEDRVKGTVADAAWSVAGLGIGKFVLQPLAKGGGWILKSLVKGVNDFPLKGIRVNPSQLTKFSIKHGEDMAEFMTKRGFLGEDAIELAAKDAAKFQQNFDAIALNKDIKIPIESLGNRFAEEITDLAGGGKRVVPSVARDISEKLLKEWQSISDQAARQGRNFITPEELTLFRRTIDDLIPDSQFIEPTIKNVGITLRKIMNDVVAEPKGANLLGIGEKNTMKELGRELSKLYDFLKIAEKQSGLGRGNLVANIPKLFLGGTGAMLGLRIAGPGGAILGGLGGLVGEMSLKDPEILKILLKAAQAGQKVGGVISPTVQKLIRAIPTATAIGAGAVSQFLGR